MTLKKATEALFSAFYFDFCKYLTDCMRQNDNKNYVYRMKQECIKMYTICRYKT
jgi:hypothetical protein